MRAARRWAGAAAPPAAAVAGALRGLLPRWWAAPAAAPPPPAQGLAAGGGRRGVATPSGTGAAAAGGGAAPYAAAEVDAPALAAGVLAGDRRALSRAITLVESVRPEHQPAAAALMASLAAARPPAAAGAPAFRVGVSGPPGAGKSTLIEALGLHLLGGGARVAVLAVDPSSEVSGGAVLGDWTRMPRLTAAAGAYVRPSPARGTLGGVAAATADAADLCAAAGYPTLLVETVGVGQSETAVKELVDCFVLVVPAALDELQVLKRGITEVADVVVVNKADGGAAAGARRAAAAFELAMGAHRRRHAGWAPRALAVSAAEGRGVPELAAALAEFRAALAASGELDRARAAQRARQAWAGAEEAVLRRLRGSAAVRALRAELERAVAAGALPPRVAAARLADCFVAEECGGSGSRSRREQ